VQLLERLGVIADVDWDDMKKTRSCNQRPVWLCLFRLDEDSSAATSSRDQFSNFMYYYRWARVAK
jgi:hypothetical protein